MKKNLIYKFLGIFLIVIFLNFNNVLAGKDDLLLKDEGGKGYSISDAGDACKYFDEDKDGHLTIDEIKSKNDGSAESDRNLTILQQYIDDGGYMSDSWASYFKKIEGDQSVENDELVKYVLDEWNKRRTEEGLDEVSNTDLAEWGEVRQFYSPKKVGEAGTTGSNLENIMDSADEFVDEANDTANVKTSALQDFSNTFYGIFLAVATAVTVIVGIIIGIKYMVSSAGERANVKQMLVPYAVGCVVVYGSFGIWALVVSLLNNV